MTPPFPTFEVFAGREGDTFTASGVAMTLTTATTWGRPFAAEARQPFTLQFHGPAEPVLAEATYHLQHEVLGGMDVFLVPIGPDTAGMCYEAIFT